MKAFKWIILIAIIAFLGSTSFSEPCYFDDAGNKITLEEYKKKNDERKAILKNIETSRKDPLKSKPKIIKTKSHTKKHNTKTISKAPKEQDIPRDKYGRPLKNSQGQWITYADVETNSQANAYMNNLTHKYNLRQNSFSDNPSYSDAYKEQYLKRGKNSDLLEYRRELRKSHGLDDNIGDYGAAKDADRYKKRYLKSGKSTDLLKYRRAHDKAMGYSD